MMTGSMSPLPALALAPTVDLALEVLDPALEVLAPAPDEIVGRQSRETPAATLLLLRASLMHGNLISLHK